MNDDFETRDRRRGSLFLGLLLIGLGSVFLLDRLNIADFDDIIQRWWPMIIVLVGVSRLFRGRSAWSGLWLIGIGAWLQMARLNVFDMTIGNSWPLLLIFIGAGIVIRALGDTVRRNEGGAS